MSHTESTHINHTHRHTQNTSTHITFFLVCLFFSYSLNSFEFALTKMEFYLFALNKKTWIIDFELKMTPNDLFKDRQKMESEVGTPIFEKKKLATHTQTTLEFLDLDFFQPK